MSGSHSPCTPVASGASPESGERGTGAVRGEGVVGEQPSWNPYNQQDPDQWQVQPPYQGQPPYPPQQPYEQQAGRPIRGRLSRPSHRTGRPDRSTPMLAPAMARRRPLPRRKTRWVRNILSGVGAVVGGLAGPLNWDSSTGSWHQAPLLHRESSMQQWLNLVPWPAPSSILLPP
jgi:hypothetical protein